MSKGFKLLRGGLMAAFIAVLCSGCAETYKAVRDGQPDMSDPNLFVRDTALFGPKVEKDGTPSDCVLAHDQLDSDKDYIRKCTEAVRYLVDKSWFAYQHELYSLNTDGNFLADAMQMGLSTSALLVAPGTKNVLNAIITGLGGLKTNANEDLLYKNSIMLIIMQMQKDRNSWLTVIESNLNSGHYQTMTEASTDLQSYFYAGTWDHAIISMQSDAGAQNAACEAALKNVKANTGTSATSSATEQCSTNPSSATSVPLSIVVPFDAGGSIALSIAGTKAIQSAEAAFKAAKQNNTNLQINVQGLTDDIGGDAINKPIADKRAAAVIAQLTTDGIDSNDIAPALAPDLHSQPGAKISFVVVDKPPAPAQPVQQSVTSQDQPAKPVVTGAVATQPTDKFTVNDLKTGAVFKEGNDTVTIMGVPDGDKEVAVVGPNQATGTVDAHQEPVDTLFPKLTQLISPGHS